MGVLQVYRDLISLQSLMLLQSFDFINRLTELILTKYFECPHKHTFIEHTITAYHHIHTFTKHTFTEHLPTKYTLTKHLLIKSCSTITTTAKTSIM